MPKPQRGRSRQSPSAPANPPAELASNSSIQSPPSLARSVGPVRRATYPEAVARYEQGVRALQEHRFHEAFETFHGVVTQYPEEKELADRARCYMTLCERQLNSVPEPTTIEERLYAATLALNAGDSEKAMRHLGEIVTEDPDHDGALYMLAVVHAMKEEPASALSYLQRAIERNPENRALALQDGDLERLMQDESIRTAIEAAGGQRSVRRHPPRTRPMR